MPVTTAAPSIHPDSGPCNRLLASLPDEDSRRLSPHFRAISLQRRHALMRQGQPVQEIVFPTGGVCSLVRTTDDGHAIEIIGIGAEGATNARLRLQRAAFGRTAMLSMAAHDRRSCPIGKFFGDAGNAGDGARSTTADSHADYGRPSPRRCCQLHARNGEGARSEGTPRGCVRMLSRAVARFRCRGIDPVVTSGGGYDAPRT
jgi:hypothetical protein